MKKLLSVILAVVMVLALASCGNDPKTTTAAPTQPPATQAPGQSTEAPAPQTTAAPEIDYKKLDLRMTTGSSGSVLYMFGSQFIDLFKELYPGSKAEVAVGGGVSNISTVSNGDFNIGSTAVPALFAALNGVDPFPEKMTEIRAVFRTDPIWGVAMVTKASGINSLKEVAEKKMAVRLAVMPVGNYTELFARQLLSCYGITLDDIKAWGGTVQYTSHAEASDLFKDGHLDMYVTMINKGHAYGTEIFTNVDMKMLPLDAEDIKPLMDLGYSAGFMPKDAFRGVDEEVPIAISSNLFISSADADEDLVYLVTKTFYEHFDDFALTNTALTQLNKETEIFDCFGAELHPGAERYYKEIGILK